jgi:hypothetical protein
MQAGVRIGVFCVEVIFAEGAPAETLLTTSREGFANFVEYERLHGSEEQPARKPFAPIIFGYGGRAELQGLLRLACHPLSTCAIQSRGLVVVLRQEPKHKRLTERTNAVRIADRAKVGGLFHSKSTLSYRANPNQR